MRSKNILSVAAFVIAFLFSAFIASLFIPIPKVPPVAYSVSYSCPFYRMNSSVGNKLTDFILRDENNGSRNDQAAFNFDLDDKTTVARYAGTVEEYVDDSSSMNVKAFPADFQFVWRKHMKAWRDYSTFLNRTAANLDDVSREDFYKFDEFYGGEINRSYKEVLRIAGNYGADVR